MGRRVLNPLRREDRPRSDVRRVTALLALVVLTAILAGVWNLFATRRQLREEVLGTNRSTAKTGSQTLAANLDVQRSLVAAVAASQSLVGKVSAGAWSQVEEELRLMREIDPRIQRSTMLDAAGIVRATVSARGETASVATPLGVDESRCDCFIEAVRSAGTYLSPTVQYDAYRVPYFALSAAVRDSAAEPIAVVVAEVPVSNLTLIVNALDVPDDSSVNVFTENGVQLTNVERPTEAFPSYEIFRLAERQDSAALPAAVPGKPRTRLVAFERVPRTNWLVVVEQPGSAASIAATTKRLLTFGAFINVILIAGAVIARRLFRQLETERTRTSSILDSIPDGAVTTDPSGVVTTVNPAMETLTGIREVDAVGRRFPDVFPIVGPQDQPVDWRAEFLEKVVRSHIVATSRGYDLGLRVHDGRVVPVSHMVAPIIGRSGELTGCVAVVRDVAYEKELDQMKSSLISTVSHELRTPLTMIQGFSELLLSRSLGPEREREALSRINASSERLARLIDDLLSVSRIESGRLVVRAAPMDLREVVDEVAGLFADRRPVTVEAEAPLPLIHADRDMVVQIMTNLVSNAIKYSPDGEPVSVELRPGRDVVEVTVVDRGIGLSGEELGRLFQKFVRVDRKEVREVGGTGLGLFISRSLVEMQGGRIWADSQPGRGSRFSFSLPVVRSEPASGEVLTTEEPAPSRIAVPSGESVERPPSSRQRRDA